MFEYSNLTKDNIIALTATGKIRERDYESLVPMIEKIEREGMPIKLLVEVDKITGITGKALLTDIATYFKHAKNMDKVAIVGEKKSEELLAKVADPFVKADVKYFPREEKVLAESWIQQ